eukprot:GGOE01036942.1.p1 GENE.GGOE01036942.1~~GGOE01036942.1.p1  ORF type:complete len:242 (-),score=66.64 GGOE01036942.1:322-1047(-)
MKRARDGPLFGPVPVYVVNEEQLPYAERIARKFIANNIPAAVVQVFDRASLATHMQALAEGVTFHSVVIHPHSEATRTIAFIGANIELDTVPAYEDLDPDTAIDFIQQQVVVAGDKRAKWYEQQEAKGKLRRKQAMLRAQLAKEEGSIAVSSAPRPPPPPSILGSVLSGPSPAVLSSLPAAPVVPLPAVPPLPPPPMPPMMPATPYGGQPPPPNGVAGALKQGGTAINIQSILNTLKRAKG